MKLIIIMGQHRSGSSLLASCLERLGATVGHNKATVTNKQNPKGYWENMSFLEFHDRLLGRKGQKWCTVREELASTPEDVESYCSLILQEFPDAEAAVIKDPRLTFMLPMLTKVAARMKLDMSLLFSTRQRSEAIQSLCKAQGISPGQASSLFDAAEGCRPPTALVVEHHRNLYDHQATMREVCRHCRLTLVSTSDLVDRKLHRVRHR